MAITHHFKGSANGYGYFAYIEEGQLVIGENWSREGGINYRGPYEHARSHLVELKVNDEKLYNNIVEYYTEQYFQQLHDELHDKTFEKQVCLDDATKTILYKVALHMDNQITHKVMVRGRFQSDIVKKLTPATNEVLMLQTPNGNIFAVHSSNISAIEFVEEF